jgi:glycosyltransferase involved in cell wall biosynthesis
VETQRPKKIIYLITDLQIGGAQKELCTILPHLNREKFDPLVVCLFGGNGFIADNIKKSGTPVFDLRMRNKLDIFAIFRLYRLFKDENPAILHSSLFHASIVARVVGKFAQVPIIITWRHNITHGNNFREWINKTTTNLDDCLVAVSKAVKEKEIQSTGVKNLNVVVIYNGINTHAYKKLKSTERRRIRNRWGIPEDAYLIGSIGRLHPSKGFDTLLQSFKKIRSKIPNSWLIIVGEGEIRKNLEETARKLEIFDFTVFTGTITNIPEILGILDVFVLASRWEGLPIVILEAMASRLPVIATSVGGIQEIITNNETGLLIKPEDPDAIVEMVFRIYNDIVIATSLGKAGRAKILSKFNVIPITDQFQKLYSELLSNRLG